MTFQQGLLQKSFALAAEKSFEAEKLKSQKFKSEALLISTLKRRQLSCIFNGVSTIL